MKPLTLSFQNIRSYTQFGPVSFENRSLVGILGDTGAGKSTILEGLCLALYGQSSWQGGKHEDLMADGAPHMSVDLTFAHDGHTWRVQRTYYSSTRPTMASLRNIDTGLAVDSVRAVNTTIASLLRMDFDAFRSAVLLPQGQFQKLLHSSRTERAPLLKGIFGADLVDQVATLAASRSEQLTALVSDAQLARAAVPADPAGDAAAADADTERYGTLADTLGTRRAEVTGLIDTARADRDTLAQLQQAHTRVNGAADTLTRDDVAARVAAAATTANEITGQIEQCRADTDAARQRARAAQNALTAATQRGEGRSQVDAALTLLPTLPRRAENLAQHAAELNDEQHRIDTETERGTQRRDALTGRRDIVTALKDAAALSEQAAENADAAVTKLRDATVDSLTVAASIRGHLTEQRGAEARIAELTPEVATRRAALNAAREAEADAQANLTTLRRTASAAAASTGLHPGDDCPVCVRKLPKDWHAPDPDAAAQIAAAEAAVSTARADCDDAALSLQQTGADLQTAESSRDTVMAEALVARQKLTSQLERVTAAAAALAAGLDADGLTAAVSAAADHAAIPEAAATPARQAADDLCAPAMDQAAVLRRQAHAARTEATTAETKLASENTALEQAEGALARDKTTLGNARDRWQQSVAEVAKQLRDMPAPVRATVPKIKAGTLPEWLREAASGPLAAATGAAHAMSNELAAHEQNLTAAREQLDELSELGEQLRARHEHEVAGPLREACRSLDRAAMPLRTLTEVGIDVTTPAVADDESDAAAVDGYLHAVTKALSDAAAALTRRTSRAQKEAANSLTKAISAWRAALAAAAEADDNTPAAPAPADDDVLTPDALTPVTVAARLARRRAEQARAAATEARESIGRAASLDDAIAAGQARASALAGLRSSLSRSRFPAHLIARRTEVLLGLASDLFGRLSGGEFGFSDDFQVVVRRSGSVRDPKTLSGGETFLASLALALSLVELYSRAGGRLGALFLDEGFGSLDLESLSAALDALSAETGGEKLVAVISHLHAVAEAVTDVLWVSKQLGVSSAAWLDVAQVEALVSADAEAGLLN